MVTFGSELLAAAVAGSEQGEHPLRHVAELPPREGRRRPWPAWAEPDVVRAFTDRGISSPWAHQVEAANLVHAGRHVVISTGTASGKSLAYQLPILNALATDPRAPMSQMPACTFILQSRAQLADLAVSCCGPGPGAVRALPAAG